jgi:hypothetical protein
MAVPKIKELRAMTDDQLAEGHDAITTYVNPGVSYYLEELGRRHADRQGRRIVWLSWVIAGLTLVLAFLAGTDLWLRATGK